MGQFTACIRIWSGIIFYWFLKIWTWNCLSTPVCTSFDDPTGHCKWQGCAVPFFLQNIRMIHRMGCSIDSSPVSDIGLFINIDKIIFPYHASWNCLTTSLGSIFVHNHFNFFSRFLSLMAIHSLILQSEWMWLVGTLHPILLIYFHGEGECQDVCVELIYLYSLVWFVWACVTVWHLSFIAMFNLFPAGMQWIGLLILRLLGKSRRSYAI